MTDSYNHHITTTSFLVICDKLVNFTCGKFPRRSSRWEVKEGDGCCSILQPIISEYKAVFGGEFDSPSIFAL